MVSGDGFGDGVRTFSACASTVDLAPFRAGCAYDHCVANRPPVDCSSAQVAAAECGRAGACVDWRPRAAGRCPFICPGNMIYKPCETKISTVCGMDSFDKNSSWVGEGCFCPDGAKLLEPGSSTCVSKCPECWTESKQPKYVGDSWLEGCEQKECLEGGRVLASAVPCQDEAANSRCPPGVRLMPAPPVPLLPGAIGRAPTCCPPLQCDACVHKGVYHQVGERWNDTASRCVLFSCGLVGGRAAVHEAITSCSPFNFDHCEDSAEVVYDAQGCCPVSCQPRAGPGDSPRCRTFKTLEIVRVGSCNSSELELGHCSGTCQSSTRLDHARRSVVRACSCCRESLVEQRSATLRCDDGTTRSYAYDFVRACSCLALC
uniref:Mucin-2-like n=1 Tax=Petromyzon marinus TaxID=7757 RepID=A0AAJ7XJY0_PETMA|nr:mucin-2-like [Petromyzon marinus]